MPPSLARSVLPFRVVLIALELPCLRAACGAHLVSGPGPLARLVWGCSSAAALCWFHLFTSAFALLPRSFMPALPRFSWLACVLPQCSTLALRLLFEGAFPFGGFGLCEVQGGALFGVFGADSLARFWGPAFVGGVPCMLPWCGAACGARWWGAACHLRCEMCFGGHGCQVH